MRLLGVAVILFILGLAVMSWSGSYSSFGLDLGLSMGSLAEGPSGDGLLLESGDYLLLESGDYLLLE